jgi:hypothetical protein
MAGEPVSAGEPEAPPAGEAIHLPGPSYIPIATAAGVAVAVVGVVISWILVAIGLVVTLYCVWRWIRDTRRDISELPLQH